MPAAEPFQTIAEPPPAQPLTLDPLTGPPLSPVQVTPGQVAIMGRSSQSQAVLPDESVSRRHAQIAYLNGTWFITDLGSRHGTMLNGARLETNGVAPLKPGDLVGVGPWTFRVRIGTPGGTVGHVTTQDTMGATQRVEKVAERELAAITQNRLNLLMNCAAAVAGISDEQALAKVILNAAIEGTGFPRAALLRDVGAEGGIEVRVECDVDLTAGSTQPGSFSRSLIAVARTGEMARLTADAPMQTAESIMRLGITAAMCAPIMIGNTVAAYLYLDARTGEQQPPTPGAGARGQARGVQHDAAAFCQAIARMCSLAMGNLSRLELERRQQELVKDLNAAREAQRLIMPPDTGQIGPLKYAVRVKSGRYVAGDLFDVVDMGGGRVAFFLGDVAGKGISAAILMATAQTYLNAALRVHMDPAKAIAEVNKYICEHAAANKFISLWLGIIDTATGKMTYVDAGHGHWLFLPAGGKTRRVETTGGIPLGIDADFDYHSDELSLGPGSRLVVFSDGVVEQPGPEGAMFGLARAIEALEGSSGPEQDVQTLFDAVINFAQTDSLADDTTVSSVTCG